MNVARTASTASTASAASTASNGLEKSATGVLLSLKRGLRILEAIATSNGASTAKSLRHETHIKIGTCYHILRTLEDEGFVMRLPGSRLGLGSSDGQLASTVFRLL